MMNKPRSAALRRRQALAWLAAAIGAMPLARAATPERVKVEVWKDPGCGCCKEWVKHLQVNGFEVLAHDVDGPADIRARLGMPDAYGSCHTARVGGPGGYLLEGHVPAREVRRLLAERPKAIGLAVPAMPVGSPGMEVGNRRDPYDVLLVTADGRASVFQSYR
ncbi:putative metal-binding protein [Burkholderiales bacterium JOSHI_001]|nr:putative metal-binding protein [Burkholderiales bacterium JOSHI_001]